MKLKTEIVLILTLILLALFFRYAFWNEHKFGSDFFHHYTVVEQSLESGKLSNINYLGLCYDGVKSRELHPLGFYFLPYLLGKFIGVKYAFIVSPLILGLASLILGYFLLRKLLGLKVALLTFFLTAISPANISKSYPFSYRGETLIYPFLLLSLIFLYYAFINKNLIKSIVLAVISGIISGITVIVWNGFLLVYIISLLSVTLYVIYSYFKNSEIINRVKIASIFVVSQFIIGYILSNINISSRATHFMNVYYPIIVGFCLSLFLMLYLSKKLKIKYNLFIAYSFAIFILLLLSFQKFKVLLSGYGAIRKLPTTGALLELTPPNLFQFYFYFFIIPILFLVGLFYYIRDFDEKRAFYLGLLLPSLYLIISAARYFYVSSLPIISIAALIASKRLLLFKKKKFDLSKFIIIILCIIMLFYSFYNVPKFFSFGFSQSRINALNYLYDNSNKDSCIISAHTQGAEVEFFSKRYSYFNTIGLDYDRLNEAYSFILTNNMPEFNNTNMYFLFEENDLFSIFDFVALTNLTNIDGTILYKLYENAYLNPYENVTLHFFNKSGNVSVMKIQDQNITYLKSYYNGKFIFNNKDGDGCVHNLMGSIFYFNNAVCNANLYKMVTGQEIDGLEKIYFKDKVAIYKINGYS